jgi:predicted PurR-regulated permease PerM
MTPISIPIPRQLLYWLVVLTIFALLIWLLSDILLPFVAGAALAYFLDPLADRLERLGMSRIAATSAITLLFVAFMLAVLVLVAPLLQDQFVELIEKLPRYLSKMRSFFDRILHSDLAMMLTGGKEVTAETINGAAPNLMSALEKVWSGGIAVISMLSVLFVTPVVAYYLLLDWDRMISKVDNWLPRAYAPTIRRLGREIDGVLAGFIRGQGTVCLVLAVFYAIALTLAGLNFGLLAGVVAGFIAFIPYIGTFIGLMVSTLLAVAQFWPDYMSVLLVVAIFLSGQLVESNVLSPVLVGRSVRLHPVWIIFSLFAFGSLFGFVGVLLAVPIAASLGVLARFAVDQYLHSALYGNGAPVPSAAPSPSVTVPPESS